MNWTDMVKVTLDKGAVAIELGPLMLIPLVLVLFGWFVWLRKRAQPRNGFEIVKAELVIANLGKVELKPNHETINIAHQAWVELATRKAALPFDEDHDVIAEIYDSWHEMFGRIRDLAKAVPAQQIRASGDTQKLVQIMVAVLNFGLRPHLTRWQARFRSWYVTEAEQNPGKSPQEVQRGFPQYEEMVADLKEVNKGIVAYADWLRRLAHGNKEPG